MGALALETPPLLGYLMSKFHAFCWKIRLVASHSFFLSKGSGKGLSPFVTPMVPPETNTQPQREGGDEEILF